MITVDIRHLTTGYATRRGYVEIEKDLTAALSSGELTCLLGPNGAGKSTLLRTLSGFLVPLKGTITIDGKELRTYSQAELSKKVSVVLTEKPETTSMSVEQLVALGRSPYTGFWGRLSGRDEKVVRHSMEVAHVYEMRERLVSTLSDGERQKVMIAKALAQETPIIFLDEPTAFLDFQSKVETMLLLKKVVRRENKTVFLSTHDVNMALQLADRIWLVDKKIGVSIGTSKELAEAGELQKYFYGPGIRFNQETGLFDIEVGATGTATESVSTRCTGLARR